MDRIHDNVAKMDAQFAKRGEWQRLRTFQCSPRDDGYKWLQERRNLIVHSLHLQPIAPDDGSNFGEVSEVGESDNDTVFTAQFNHLNHAHREKLRPRENWKASPNTTSCQLRWGIEHIFPQEGNPLELIFNSVGFSHRTDFPENAIAERFFDEDRLVGAWRPWFNIDSER